MVYHLKCGILATAKTHKGQILPPLSLHVDWFTDSCLLAIGRGWPALRSLCVGGKAITTTGLASVGEWVTGIVICKKMHNYMVLSSHPDTHPHPYTQLIPAHA